MQRNLNMVQDIEKVVQWLEKLGQRGVRVVQVLPQAGQKPVLMRFVAGPGSV